MIDYKDKLAALTEKKQQLIEKEKKLFENRKKQIGELAHKMGLTGMNHATLAGIFDMVKKAIADKDKILEEWQARGERFLKPKKSKSEKPKKSP